MVAGFIDIQKGTSRRKQKRNGRKPRMNNAPETHSPFQIANCLCWSSFTLISHFNVIIPDSPSAFSSFLLPVPLIVLQYEYAKSNRLCSNPFSMISLLKRPHIACKFILHMQSSSSNHLLQTRSSAHLNDTPQNGQDPNQRNVILLSLGFGLTFFGTFLLSL